MAIITIAAQKGGVGKTTTALSVSTYLASIGKKVLFIDFDGQCNASLIFSKGVLEEDKAKTISVILGDSKQLNRINDTIKRSHVENLDFIPAHTDLSRADRVISTIMQREIRLKKALSYIKGDYDFIFIDTPPYVNWVHINAFVASDYILLPVSPSRFDLSGIALLLETLTEAHEINPHVELMGILVTFYDQRENISKEVYDLLIEKYGTFVFDTRIPINTKFEKATSKWSDIYSYDPQAAGAQAYKSFVEKEFLPKLAILEDAKRENI